VNSLNGIIEKLLRSRRNLLRAADAVPPEEWRTCPAEGRWSAAELAAHLIKSERRIIRSIDRLLQEPPKGRPFFKRFHVPLALVEARLFRRKSPFPIDCECVREKEEMLAELREVRGRTLAFIEETKGRDLSQYCMAHPFLGTLTAHEWLQFIGSHEIRHTKQMLEITAALPKSIAKLQK
jgi:uncharacterized damage-inducible protein DinB